MKKEHSQKIRDYGAPTVEWQDIFSGMVCQSDSGATENYEVDNNFEW